MLTKEQVLGLIQNFRGDKKTLQELNPILKATVELAASGGNVQSDWAQTDSEAEDFIKNKPIVNGLVIDADDYNASLEDGVLSVNESFPLDDLLDAFKSGRQVVVKYLTTYYSTVVSLEGNVVALDGDITISVVPDENNDSTSFDESDNGNTEEQG